MKPTYSIRTVVCAVVALALLAGIVTRQAAAQARIDLDVKRAVVRIVPEQLMAAGPRRVEDQPGSGVIIHPSGIVLTAWHVLSQDDDFSQRNYWDDFVVEVIEDDDSSPPVARYRAKIIAVRPEDDLALLRLDRKLNSQPLTPDDLTALAYLPVFTETGDNSRLLDPGNTELRVLGYPKPFAASGEESELYIEPATLSSRSRSRGELIVQETFDAGYSGGPVLVEAEGRLAVAGIVLSARGSRTVLRDLAERFRGFEWVAGEQRAYAQNIRVAEMMEGNDRTLQFDLDVQSIGLEGAPVQLQINFYDADHRPWRPGAVGLLLRADGSVYWEEDIRPDRPIAVDSVQVRFALARLGVTVEQLTFRLLLYDKSSNQQLWSDTVWHQVQPAAASLLIEATATPTRRPPTSTPTLTPTRRPPTPRPTPTKTPTPRPTPTPNEPAAGATREIDGITFVYVPAGEFLMGSTEAEVEALLCNQTTGNCERAWVEPEMPQHTVVLDGFWISRIEVTNAQWQTFMQADGYSTQRYWTSEGWRWRTENAIITAPGQWTDSDFNGQNYPVVGVSWYESAAYASWLADRTGIAIRLPTEAEWEKSARGTQGRVYPWGNDWDASRANYCDSNCPNDWKDIEYSDGYALTAPVGSYAAGASPYGALDMAGNVREWVGDWYANSYVGAGQRNPTGPDSGGSRVVRGGSWTNKPAYVRSAFRNWYVPDARNFDVGFRLVAPDLSQPEMTVTPATQSDAVVNTSIVNMRAGPGTIYTVLRSYARETALEVIGKNQNASWLKVKTPDGAEGWMSASLLHVNVSLAQVPMAEAPPTPTPTVTSTLTITLNPTATSAPRPSGSDPSAPPTDTPIPPPADTPVPVLTNTPLPATTDTPAPTPTQSP